MDDVCFNQIITRFFAMNLLEGSTVESMFASVTKQFNDHKLGWDYCMATGLDNANENIRNSIKSHGQKEKNPEYHNCWVQKKRYPKRIL